MYDRTGLGKALTSIGYHKSINIDTDVELYLKGSDNKKFGIILVDNRDDIVRSKDAAKRIFELAKGNLNLRNADFNLLMIITDVCKNNTFVGMRNVLYINEHDYTLKGVNIDPVFNKEKRDINNLLLALKKEKVFALANAGINTAAPERTVVVTPIIILMCIFSYALTLRDNNMYAVSKSMIDKGQYYRMVTYAFMHGSIIHLIMNMTSLGIIGSVLEKQIGWLKLSVVYMVSAVTGAYLSINYTGEPDIMTVGASGAICGLIAANVISVMFLPKYRHGSAIKSSIMWLASIIAYGVLCGADNLCHIGGAVGGLLMMIILAFATGAVEAGNLAEASEYHFKRLNERKKKMGRMDGSREKNPACFIMGN